MCLCLSRYDFDGCIHERDIVQSIEKVTSLIYASRKAADGAGIDPLAQQTKKVVDYLLSASSNELTRTELLVRGYGNYDSVTLDKILETLLEMRWINKIKHGVGVNMDWLVRLSGEPLESYLRFKEMQKRAKQNVS